MVKKRVDQHPNQLSLFPNTGDSGQTAAVISQPIQPSEHEGLEEGVFESGISHPSTPHDATKNWGIRRADLNNLREFQVLEDFFYGIPNLNIPDDMLDALNPDEIMAKYIGAGIQKRHNRHLQSEESQKIPKEFVGLCQYLDRLAYPMMGRTPQRAEKRFSNNSGAQMKRLHQLSDKIKQAFIGSFFQNYRPSNREELQNPNAFYDPNLDGKSRQIYRNWIFDYFCGRCQRRAGSN
ncbi:hypothetical protein HYU13_03240 [Candidatus Woesearchaeota archaeon]|nr:hypothetical protein [Candidatus Woesearchaeota archaeon]